MMDEHSSRTRRDLIERLRRGPSYDYDGYKAYKLMQEAVDEIERLQELVAMQKRDMKSAMDESGHLQAENDELRAGACRFNCRTEKEAWIQGYIWAKQVDRPGIRQEAEREWKRQQKTSAQS